MGDEVNNVFIVIVYLFPWQQKLLTTLILCSKLHYSCIFPFMYPCKDTFSFVSQIKNANLSGKYLASYDVASLFTNSPVQETIDIAINLIFNYNPNLNITKKEIKKLTLFATSHAHFIFNSKIYNQIDGVATGSPHGFFVAFLFHLLFLLSLTLINGIFYCLHYTSLLLHLITTHLVSHLSLSSFISSISKLIIGIFYCLDWILLLLHLVITHLVIDFILTM